MSTLFVYPDGEIYNYAVSWKSDDYITFSDDENPWTILNTIYSHFGDTKQAVNILTEVLNTIDAGDCYVD